MANKAKGEVGFEVDGKSYTLVFSINALCELENQLGGDVANIAAAGFGGIKRYSTLRATFWAGLTDHHPNMTLQAVGKIINALGIQKADELAGEAFKLAFPPANGPLADAPAGA
jgi:hypothetical protein